MAVAITATLVGTSSPQQVQVEVTGLTVGDLVTVTGTLGSYSWPVRGADEISAESAQLIRRDNLAPINAAVTYTATVNGEQYTSSAVTVTYSPADYVLTTIDGNLVVDFAWLDNGEPREPYFHQHFTRVPGRRTSVMRYAAGGGEAGTWQVRTTEAQTLLMKAALSPGAPVVLRTNGAVRDVPPAAIVAVTSAPRVLFAGDGGLSTQRVWDLTWVEVSDPLATIPVTGWTFADMNAVITAQGGTFADLNAFIVTLGGTFADVNRFDWESEAAS